MAETVITTDVAEVRITPKKVEKRIVLKNACGKWFDEGGRELNVIEHPVMPGQTIIIIDGEKYRFRRRGDDYSGSSIVKWTEWGVCESIHDTMANRFEELVDIWKWLDEFARFELLQTASRLDKERIDREKANDPEWEKKRDAEFLKNMPGIPAAISIETFYKTSAGTWEDSDGKQRNVVEDDSHPEWKAFLIDGEQWLMHSVEPYVNHDKGQMDFGYHCFQPVAGYEYVGLYQGETYTGDGKVIDTYSNNGITLLAVRDAARLEIQLTSSRTKVAEWVVAD